eukprot:jgi/Undpi1/12442/HiC_scaffold_5.g02113.m1
MSGSTRVARHEWLDTSGSTRVARHAWLDTSGSTRVARHAWLDTSGSTRVARHEWLDTSGSNERVDTSGSTRVARHAWLDTSGLTRAARHEWLDTSGSTRAARHEWLDARGSTGRKQQAGGAGEAFERLFLAATEARERREERARERWRAETEGCTFHPTVNSLTRTKRSSEDVAASIGSVYERLHAAAHEARQRKILRDRMDPPGCTFRPKKTGVSLLPHVSRSRRATAAATLPALEWPPHRRPLRSV